MSLTPVTPRQRVLLTLLLVVFVAVTVGRTRAAEHETIASPAGVVSNRLPIIAEHRYRMAAQVRPFLLFWIRRDDVGGARVIWRRSDDGAVGFELLIGSDPARAPRKINRWGYIAEEVHGKEGRLLGVMKRSDEESIEEAKARLASEGQEGEYVFKAITGTATADEARAGVTTIRVPHDLTYRDLDSLLELVATRSENAVMRPIRLPSETRPGFLVALAELIHHSIELHDRPTRRSASAPRDSVPYVYNGALHDLTLRKTEFLSEVRVGPHTYSGAARGEFETRRRATHEATRFDLVYGTTGPLAEIPLAATYQPRWWFRVELALDDSNEF
jgi:hypothetical protein